VDKRHYFSVNIFTNEYHLALLNPFFVSSITAVLRDIWYTNHLPSNLTLGPNLKQVPKLLHVFYNWCLTRKYINETFHKNFTLTCYFYITKKKKILLLWCSCTSRSIFFFLSPPCLPLPFSKFLSLLSNFSSSIRHLF